jgi:predicted TIM-barrel fold metal-dependent hydrolase
METKTRNDGITRRGFFQLGSAALAKAGVIASSDSAKSAFGTAQARDQNKAAFASMPGKVALEEHFALAETIESSTAATYSAEFRKQILEMGSGRIAEMDRGGVELCILSLVSPGIQSVPNPTPAIALARRANDYLAENIAKNPKRLKGFAALPLQDPQAAAEELTRCVKELGFCGALANGFSQVIRRVVTKKLWLYLSPLSPV